VRLWGARGRRPILFNSVLALSVQRGAPQSAKIACASRSAWSASTVDCGELAPPADDLWLHVHHRAEIVSRHR
jgi:hypothetical protein